MKVFRHGNRWRIKLYDDAGVRRWISFDTEDAAIAYAKHVAQGLTRIDDVWQRLEKRTFTIPHHDIDVPAHPYGLVFLSDLHFGSAHTDYRQARLDAEVIRDTPGMYAIFHGDGIDNIRDIREAADYLTWKRRTVGSDDDHARQNSHRQRRVRKSPRR